MTRMATWVDPVLLAPPVNVMRVGLHPRGLARWTVNLGEVRAYFLGRLARQVALAINLATAAMSIGVMSVGWHFRHELLVDSQLTPPADFSDQSDS
jgi:hypothetical protein